MKYTGINKKEISFPIGGICTGCIGLAGNGSIVDIEIQNEPNKGSEGRFTHFAVKAEKAGSLLDARVLNTDLQSGYMGNFERDRYTGFGWGPDRGSMSGFPHFRKGEFDGTFPIAQLDFEDGHFPGKVVMRAFNPLIPTNEDDSSIPAAFFEFEIENTTDEELQYALAFSASNFYSHNNARHTYRYADGLHMMFLDNEEETKSTAYGNMTMATDCPDVSYQEYWFRGNWFDNVSVFWNDFARPGELRNRHYKAEKEGQEVYAGSDTATLAAHVEVKPGERKKVRFIWSWSMPYRSNTWQITHIGLSEKELQRRRKIMWKNYYAVLFRDSMESAVYGMKNFTRLYEDTMLYTRWMYQSSLPSEVLDAVAANAAVLKSPTCLRLEDGSFYGFEGVHPHEGCCEGSCTHVWSYAYTAAFLFPKLERSARTLEYTQSIQPDGGMGFRLQLPLGCGPTNFRPAVDGQYGTVLRVYREYLISGDLKWLQSIWQAVKKTIAYAWSRENPDQWDLDKDGILEGRQHHTLDMELFSPNSWLSGMYLAGLQAGIRLAGIVGDKEAEDEYLEVFRSGRKKLNQELFNGTYFDQKVDLTDKNRLMKFQGGYSDHSQDAVKSYWNDESGEMKYQIGEGCSIDQVIGQWHADLLNLGEVFEVEKVEQALKAVYRFNYITDMHEHVNPCRIYALNDESGLIICSYPKDRLKPAIPVPYAEETMHGFEYQAASHMILHGMEREGLQCIRAIRSRYDGMRRNPWNEMECGSNYARSMASYALLLVYSGFMFDMGRNMIGFHPLHQEDGTYFWSLDSGFGHVIFEGNKMSIWVDYGEVTVKYIGDKRSGDPSVRFGDDTPEFKVSGSEIELANAVSAGAGQCIEIIRN